MEFTNPANEATWREWERDMRARRCSPATLYKNQLTVMQLECAAGGKSLLKVTKADVQDWLAGMADYAGSSVATRYSCARAFFNWAEGEELISRSPMARLKAPANPAPLVAMPSLDDVRQVLAACEGKTFEDRRDAALIRILCEAGAPRSAEAAALRVADADLTRDDLTVIRGKGGKSRVMPMSPSTATAVSRYLRIRARRSSAGLPWLFIGTKGPMTRSGVTAILRRRCAQAGVPVIHPHQLRHLAAHRFFLAGGREGDAMRLFGWDDPAMARRYAAVAAASRAIGVARVMALGDEL